MVGELLDSRVADVTPMSMIEAHMSLDLPTDLRIEDWQILGRKLCGMDRRVSWWIADWWAFGDETYGARAKLIAEGVFGANSSALSYATLRTYGVVSRRFEPSSRLDSLSFAHHQEVCGLDQDAARSILQRASDGGWSVRETRTEVLKARLGIAPQPASTVQPSMRDDPVGQIKRRANKIVLAAFSDWFGIGEEYARVLMALYQAGGEQQTWQDLSRAVSTHAPMRRGTLHEAISSLRGVMEAEAIDRDDDGYSLTEVGFAECRRAFREMGGQLIGMGAEPANDSAPMRNDAEA